MLSKKDIFIFLFILIAFILLIYFGVYKRLNYSDVRDSPCETYAKENNMTFIQRVSEFDPFNCIMWNQTKLRQIRID